jgi:hypothetical protein
VDFDIDFSMDPGRPAKRDRPPEPDRPPPDEGSHDDGGGYNDDVVEEEPEVDLERDLEFVMDLARDELLPEEDAVRVDDEVMDVPVDVDPDVDPPRDHDPSDLEDDEEDEPILDRGPWLKRAFYGEDGELLGYLCHNREQATVAAHCYKHDRVNHKCHVQRVLQKRPLGYLCAWLLASSEFLPCERNQHFGCRLERGDDTRMSLHFRTWARDLASFQDQLDVFFELEREAAGDNAEPANL